MQQTATTQEHDFSDRTKYDALMEVVRNRMTVRAFDPGYTVPRATPLREPTRNPGISSSSPAISAG